MAIMPILYLTKLRDQLRRWRREQRAVYKCIGGKALSLKWKFLKNEKEEQMKKLVTMMVMVLFVTGIAYAGGTADEAKTLVTKAIASIQSEGKDKSFVEFSNNQGKFVDRDLYIFVVDFNGLTLAHGGNAKLVGKDMSGLKDADGEYFIKKMVTLAQSKGSGWVDYKWANPVSKKIEPKSTYIQAKDNYFVGCGIYK
jgi:signal transduction histidine kinase